MRIKVIEVRDWAMRVLSAMEDFFCRLGQGQVVT